MTFTTTNILTETPDRLLLLPVRDHEAFRFYKEAIANFWTAEEVDLAHDNFDVLDKRDRQALMYVLAFFAAADGIVGENLAVNVIPQVQVAEMRAFYTFQAAIETIHAEVYGLLIETLVKDPAEQAELFSAIHGNEAVKMLGDWALQWTDEKTASFGERLVAFACVEGILFSGPFAVVFWFKSRGLLPGLCKSNEFIARDEAQHMRFACFLFKDRLLPSQRPSNDRVYEIVQSCVDVEKDFVKFAIADMPGLNSRSMSQYIEFVADVLLTLMGVPPLYNAANPFAWMTMIGMPAKQNFFEGRVSEYKRAAGAASELEAHAALSDDDF